MTEYEVVTVKTQVGRWSWRHPIHSWRFKRLMREHRKSREENPLLAQFDKDLERAFLFGTDQNDSAP